MAVFFLIALILAPIFFGYDSINHSVKWWRYVCLVIVIISTIVATLLAESLLLNS
jgi:hypothetical protein